MGTGPLAAAKPMGAPTAAIPVARGLLLLGNTLDLMTAPASFFVDCYRTYGPVFRTRAMGRGGIVLAGPEIATFLSTRQGRDAFRSREVWQGMVHELGATEVVNGADGERHAALRSLVREGFSRRALHGEYDELVGGCDRALDTLCAGADSVPVVALSQRIAAEQLGHLMIGMAATDHAPDILHAIKSIINVHVSGVWPRWMLGLPKYKRSRAGIAHFIEVCRAEFAKREACGGPDSATMAVLRANRDQPDLMPDHNLTITLLGPFIAGLDSMANTLGSAVYGVLKHPDVLRRIQAEADILFAGGPVEDDAVAGLAAADGAMMEAMRLWPNALAQMRYTTHDFDFCGYRIPADEKVMLATTVPHFMDEYFPHAARFDIDRYARPRSEHLQKGAYSPFGRGPHSCVGQGMAEGLMAINLARIFHRYDLALTAPDYELETRLTPTPGPAMRFRARVLGERRPAAA